MGYKLIKLQNQTGAIILREFIVFTQLILRMDHFALIDLNKGNSVAHPKRSANQCPQFLGYGSDWGLKQTLFSTNTEVLQ